MHGALAHPNTMGSMGSMQTARRSIESLGENQGATRDASNVGGSGQTKRRWTRGYDAQRANPSSSLGLPTVLHYNDLGDEEMYTAELAQRIVDDAVSANAASMIFNVQGRSWPDFVNAPHLTQGPTMYMFQGGGHPTLYQAVPTGESGVGT